MKIDYGIYLGISSASIAKMEDGVPVILKSETFKDSLPVCIFFNKEGSMKVGDSAFNAHKNERIISQKDWSRSSNNSFVEFTKTLGTDKTYYITNANKSFTSTQLVAEIFKTLIAFEKVHQIFASVITVPNAFRSNQIDAVREAGKLAGLQQVEILQESVAASMSYGLDSVKYQGYSLVFFFDDIFNVSLMRNNRIVDTEGDNFLGGKNLDFAIVNKIILPYIKDNFVIDFILSDDTKIQILRNSLRFYAEAAKEKLAYNEKHDILTNFGDIPGKDDEGEEFELDITITQADITRVLSPVFQKAIEISKSLLKRNNLEGSALDSLILVGGPTFSPLLRKMLEDQICKPDTGINSKTAIVKGAALYASTIDVSEEIREQKRDKTKIQLEISNESSTLETEEFVSIKILEDKTQGQTPEKVFAQITRGDKCWTSGNVEIDTIGEVIEIMLVEVETNQFEVSLIDEKGNRLESEPSNFSIIHTRTVSPAVLPYNIGTELKDKTTGRIIFRTISGLNKSKQLPASGVFNYSTNKILRPGNKEDFFGIPIYQGDHDCEGSRAIHNHHGNTILITGSDLPSLLPENSEVNIELNIDINQKITGIAYFPHLAFTYEFELATRVDFLGEEQASYLFNEINKGLQFINQLKSKGIVGSEIDKAGKELELIKSQLEKAELVADNQQKALVNLRRVLKVIDGFEAENEWSNSEETLKEILCRLEKANNDFGNDIRIQVVNQFRSQIEEVIKTKDLKLGQILIEEIEKFLTVHIKLSSIVTVKDLLFELTENEVLTSSEFQNYFEQLSELKMNENVKDLQSIYNKLMEYETKV